MRLIPLEMVDERGSEVAMALAIDIGLGGLGDNENGGCRGCHKLKLEEESEKLARSISSLSNAHRKLTHASHSSSLLVQALISLLFFCYSLTPFTHDTSHIKQRAPSSHDESYLQAWIRESRRAEKHGRMDLAIGDVGVV